MKERFEKGGPATGVPAKISVEYVPPSSKQRRSGQRPLPSSCSRQNRKAETGRKVSTKSTSTLGKPKKKIENNPRTNARMGRVDRNWTKSDGRPPPMAGGFVSGSAYASPTLPGKMTFRVAIFTEPDPQGTGRRVLNAAGQICFALTNHRALFALHRNAPIVSKPHFAD